VNTNGSTYISNCRLKIIVGKGAFLGSISIQGIKRKKKTWRGEASEGDEREILILSPDQTCACTYSKQRSGNGLLPVGGEKARIDRLEGSGILNSGGYRKEMITKLWDPTIGARPIRERRNRGKPVGTSKLRKRL